ncbi:hypothetical protein RRG08_058656 [Elysia crispata]|uniref:Uncharacterized protein n=1 Tax=Elysia crispata TaxID=231223 RepID=A0AAE0Z0G5_9GAST|nr:hypothetical protein RRG08_058656 [Elysia crispata]
MMLYPLKLWLPVGDSWRLRRVAEVWGNRRSANSRIKQQGSERLLSPPSHSPLPPPHVGTKLMGGGAADEGIDLYFHCEPGLMAIYLYSRQIN